MKGRIKRFLPWWLVSVLRRVFFGAVEGPALVSNISGHPEVLNCLVAYNVHGGYCVPRSSMHRPAAQDIMKGRVFEPDTIAYITALAGAGDIVHAGTYFGDFLPVLSRASASSGLVWAFEPNPENYRCAALTIALNALHNVDLRQAALGAATQSSSMLISDEQGRGLGGASRLLGDGEEKLPAGCIVVDVVRLDDVIPHDRPVSVIHLDVEGFEQMALQGGMQVIQRHKPVLILETVPDPQWLADNLGILGYEAVHRLHINTIYAVPTSQTADGRDGAAAR